MQAERMERITDSIVVSANDLKKIDEALSSFGDILKVDFQCKDRITRIENSIDSLLNYENTKNKQIIELTLHSRSNDFSRFVRLSFSKSAKKNIEMWISGPEDLVIAVGQKLDEIIEGMNPWYSGISKIDFSRLGFILFSILVLIYFCSKLLFENVPQGIGIQYLMLCLVLPFLPLVISFLIPKLSEKVFPLTYFAIGQGEKRYNDAEKLRWGILVAFVIAIIAGLLLRFV